MMSLTIENNKISPNKINNIYIKTFFKKKMNGETLCYKLMVSSTDKTEGGCHMWMFVKNILEQHIRRLA